MTKFELDLLKEFSDDGCGGDDIEWYEENTISKRKRREIK